MRTGRTKRGFTLIETVVTVGIVAAMAAVVIPQVARQFDTADPTRVQNDLKNIQTAMETYFVNVKQVPGDLDDLANQVVVTGTADFTFGTGTAVVDLTGSENSLWKGPYVDLAIQDNNPSPEQLVPTGYGLSIVADLVCYNSTDNKHGITEATSTTAAANDPACEAGLTTDQRFVAIQIIGADCDLGANSIFSAINELFDGTETAADETGRIRCTPVTGGTTKATDVHVIYFLAIPIS